MKHANSATKKHWAVLGLLLLGAARIAGAAETYWTNAAGGVFSDAGNWLDGVLPNTVDPANFATSATYTVTFNRNETNVLHIEEGNVTFDLNGYTNYHPTGGLNCGTEWYKYPTWTLTNGVVYKDTAANSTDGVNIGGDYFTDSLLTITRGGALWSQGHITIRWGGRAVVTHGGQMKALYSTRALKVYGSLTVNGEGSLASTVAGLIVYSPSASNPDGEVAVKNGALLQAWRNFLVQAGGLVTLDGGTIETSKHTSGANTNAVIGRLRGNGTIARLGAVALDLHNYGTIQPGNTGTTNAWGAPNLTGTLIVTNGTLRQMDSGTLEMDIGGATDHDRIYASDFVMNGTCTVAMVDGYLPNRTERYKLFSWGTQSGAFTTLNLPAMRGGRTWDASSLYTTGELIAKGPTGSVILVR